MNESHSRAHDAFFVQIADRIGQGIIDGNYPIGAPLPREADLAIQHKVGRSAIREALKMLAAKGLIESRPRRGTIVQPARAWNMFDPEVHGWLQKTRPTPELVAELLEIRRAFEPAAAALTARNGSDADIERVEEALVRLEDASKGLVELYTADVEFHAAIVEGSGNRFFASLLPLITTAIHFVLRTSRSIRGRDLDEMLDNHRRLTEALRSRDPAGAQTAMAALIEQYSEPLAKTAGPRAHRESVRVTA